MAYILCSIWYWSLLYLRGLGGSKFVVCFCWFSCMLNSYLILLWESLGSKLEMLSSWEDGHWFFWGGEEIGSGDGTWEQGPLHPRQRGPGRMSHSFWCFALHTPRFTPLSLVLISASVSRKNCSFCLWLSLTAPVLVLAHGLLYLDGNALGISLIFDEASDVLKSMFCFRCSGFVAGGPSESAFLHTALTGHPSCYVHCSPSTLHVLLALPFMGLSTCPAWRESLSQQ